MQSRTCARSCARTCEAKRLPTDPQHQCLSAYHAGFNGRNIAVFLPMLDRIHYSLSRVSLGLEPVANG
jgi:hypothetical protein